MTTAKGLQSAGEILRSARTRLGVELDQVSSEIHIKQVYLQALEEDQVELLPTGPFRLGFLRSYAEYLGLESDRVEAVYRRDHGVSVRTIKKPLIRRLKEAGPIFLQPAYLLSAVFGVFLLIYLSWQWSIALRPPRLYLSLPVDNQQVSSPLLVTGEVTPDTIVLVNDRPASVTQHGSFRIELQVLPGEQMVIVEARNRRGKSRFVERTVLVVE